MVSVINKKLLPMKGHYFFFNAATSLVIPFLPIIGRQIGFSGTVVGLIYTILPIVVVIAKLLLGAVADRYKSKKLIFILFQIIMAVSLLGINYVDEIPKDSEVHFMCDNKKTVFDTNVANRTIINNCMISQILDSMQDRNSFNCQLSCKDLSSNMQGTICKELDPEYKLNYCLNKTRTLDFTSTVLKDEMEMLNQVGIFEVSNLTLEDTTNVYAPKCSGGPISTICNINCDLETVNEFIETPQVLGSQILTQNQFWKFFILIIFGWGSMAVVVSIADAICFEMLGDQPNLFGYQRLWGSIGWGVFSIICGFMVDVYSDGQNKKDYTSAFYLMLVLTTVNIIVTIRLEYVQQYGSSKIFRDIATIFSRLRVAIYFLWCIFVGTCTGFQWGFLLWHIEDIARQYDNADGGCHMNSWIKTLEGLMMAVQCIGGELPFFFFSGWILKRIGHVHCMSIVLFGIGIRYILYSLLLNPWWALPVELLHGITFGLFYATMASYASIVAPHGTEATVQGLVGSLYEGIGVSLGSLIGGILFDTYGGWLAFRMFGITSIICCTLHILIQYFLKSK